MYRNIVLSDEETYKLIECIKTHIDEYGYKGPEYIEPYQGLLYLLRRNLQMKSSAAIEGPIN